MAQVNLALPSPCSGPDPGAQLRQSALHGPQLTENPPPAARTSVDPSNSESIKGGTGVRRSNHGAQRAQIRDPGHAPSLRGASPKMLSRILSELLPLLGPGANAGSLCAKSACCLPAVPLGLWLSVPSAQKGSSCRAPEDAGAGLPASSQEGVSLPRHPLPPHLPLPVSVYPEGSGLGLGRVC